jgi:hypothetical protein
MIAAREQETFNFKVYFKTSEEEELLNIFKNYRKFENLSKAEIMLKTLKDFQNRYPDKDTLDKILSVVHIK